MTDLTPPNSPMDASPGSSANPPASSPASDEHALEMLLANILGIGVKLSMSLCVIGIVMHLAAIARSGGPTSEVTIGRHVISAGIVLLIATPVLRVIASAAAFARRREWVFAALSVAVLAVLLLSYLLGGVAA